MRIPETPPAFGDLIAKYADRLPKLYNAQAVRDPSNRYLHWSQIKWRRPPPDHSHEEWWVTTKIARQATRRELPFLDKANRPFWLAETGHLHQQLHRIDRDASGRIEFPADVPNPESRNRYLVSSLFEESIRSSQLEGAATTRREAKDMLRTGRSPRNKHERMIFNNYQGLSFIREIAGEELTQEAVLELHRVLTDQTLDDESCAGRFRTVQEPVTVVDERTGDALFEPPDAENLNERMQRLLSFANRREHDPFLHPVVQAALLHFMIGYEHPFVDGNGRTARALFYWLMVREGYWLMEYLSISSIIHRSPVQYARAYLFTESDESDFTYFLDYHLRVILDAIKQLHRYLARKSQEVIEIGGVLETAALALNLNHRQAALAGHLLKHPQVRPTIASHQRSHKVSYQTARTDLLSLSNLGLLTVSKRGRSMEFRLAPGFKEKLRQATPPE
ncbi:MAG: Fic family protein [Gammaproteobacteria bacterium]|nr:Fic family protein [Gammaproteobacteria bacterium]